MHSEYTRLRLLFWMIKAHDTYRKTDMLTSKRETPHHWSNYSDLNWRQNQSQAVTTWTVKVVGTFSLPSLPRGFTWCRFQIRNSAQVSSQEYQRNFITLISGGCFPQRGMRWGHCQPDCFVSSFPLILLLKRRTQPGLSVLPAGLIDQTGAPLTGEIAGRICLMAKFNSYAAIARSTTRAGSS